MRLQRATLTFSGLFTYDGGDSSTRLPISALRDRHAHVHGLLRLEIAGQVLPRMGFFGPDDVCFNTWVEELTRITQALGRSLDAEYTFDEGEQGQPAFVFRREGERLFVSVADSLLSGAGADPEYQDVSCTWLEFQSAVLAFMADLLETLQAECPAVAQAWWREHAMA